MMRVRVWVTLLLFVPLALLAAANWSALRTPVEVDLFLLTARWPLWPFVICVPLLLAGVYLGAALLDHGRQLRQLAALDRQLEQARLTIDRGREVALDGLAHRLEARVDALESVVEGASSGLETRLGERLRTIDEHVERSEDDTRNRLEAVAARVAAVRDELAADVGEVEDALLRALRLAGRTLEAGRDDADEDDDVHPALPEGREGDRG